MRVFRLVLLIIIPLNSFSQFVGKVISITDGDTFTLIVNNEQIKVRLHGIDCPEKNQPFGNVAKQYLSEKIFGKTVTVTEMDIDRYGRTIGMVIINGVNVNEELLKAGLAWHYKQYDKKVKWTQLEEEARKSKKGLWFDSNPTPPWEWRKKEREN